MESSTITTDHGDVSIAQLVHVYNVHRASELRKQVKRNEFFQTDEGKALNCARSKAYYERNKEKVNAKNKARYQSKKASQPTPEPEDDNDGTSYTYILG
jgi:hypothetical protein